MASLARKRSLLRAAITLALLVTAGEILFRGLFAVRGIPLDGYRKSYWNPRREENLFEPHPYLPYVLRADLRRSGVRTNSLGRRGHEPVPGAFRILCVGTSSTYGTAAEETAWPSRLEAGLADRHPDRAFDVQNAGVPGYTSADNLVDFALRGADLAPQVVVVETGPTDVLCSPIPGFRSDHSHMRRSLAEEANLFDFAPAIFEKSALFLGARHVLYGRHRYGRSGLITVTAREVRPDGVHRGWPAYRRNLRSLVALARAAGASPVLVTHPFRSVETEWDRAMEKAAEIVREVATAEGAPLAEAARGIRDPDLFADPVHLLPAGEARLAEIVLSAVEATGRLRS